jgi:hypothetical protein
VRGKISDFALTMTREAVIRGRVVDEAGIGMEGVGVIAIPASPETFIAPQFADETTATDEHGEFRIAGAPGKYTVQPQGVSYPGVRDQTQAQVVEAIAGQETEPIEIVWADMTKNVVSVPGLRLDLVGSLTGTITGGAKATRYTVTLQPVVQDGFDSWASGTTGGESTFRIDSPLPGRYRVEVSPLPADGYLKIEMNGEAAASGAVDVPAGEHGRLQIAILPHAARVSGKIVGRGPGPRLFWLYTVRDGAELETARYGAYVGTTFLIGNLAPGKYRLLAVDGAGWKGATPGN